MSASNPSQTWTRVMRQTLHLLSTGFQPALSKEDIILITRKAYTSLRQKCQEIEVEDDSTLTQKGKQNRERDAVIAEIRRVVTSENISGHEITTNEIAPATADTAQDVGQQVQDTREPAPSSVAFSGVLPTSAGHALCKHDPRQSDQIHPIP